MKKTFLTVAAFCGIVSGGMAQSNQTDTLALEQVEVLATRAQSNTPVAYTNLSKKQIEAVNHGLDMPFLLSTTPGVLVTSDAGAGVGYTSIRVRGTDATRINVTSNDIPMNDAESHSIFWVNTPDLASSLADIQVQRGVGTSTNGAGAFGASINMRTQRFSLVPFAELSGSFGSFNTHKETFKVGSGLLGNHWAFEARVSNIGSDGYRDRATSSLQSFYGQAGYFSNNASVRFIAFGGKEDTYHAWDGISRDMLETDRTYNPNGEIKRDGKVVGFYKDQKDIYKQYNYQLIWEQRITPQWTWNLGLHYTDGYGYYQEYKNARTLREYGLEPYDVVTFDDQHDEYVVTTVKKSSLVRKKILDSGFGGGVFSLRYGGDRLHATVGGGFNRYVNDHSGNVIWVENYCGPLDPNHEYYRNRAEKNDFNIYAKGNYTIWRGLSAYADLQYRHIGYTIEGVNDKWDWTASPEHMQTLDVDETFDFFNPKAGLNWQINANHRTYASFGVAHKEPTRNNYNDGPLTVHPKAERLLDWELGYAYSSGRWTAGINLYYMKYKDQLVLNGKLNEIGELMAENVPDSYRMGIELTAGVKITDWLRWDINGALSRNRIRDYVGYVSDYDADWNDLWTQTAINKGSTTIAFSPSFIGNSIISFNYRGFAASFISQYVSRQYLDNFQNKEDSLDPYFVSNLEASYTFKLPHIKAITAGVSIYNLFGARYENNGYSQTAAVYDGDNYTLVSSPMFYPMAGTNLLVHLTFKF
ncbi:MAG: TonB-dependent receptor [Muribaculaceae bacterium]|nr:TonB-dependent receptor [Muribaculaceae bacterium]